MRAVGPILARWEMLQSGEIDAGLQGAPLNYMAVDQGFPSLCEPRQEVPYFQFTSLNADSRWATANGAIMQPFMRAFVRAHRWFFANRKAATAIAMTETGITEDYALRAWDEYTADEIFPRDGDANTRSGAGADRNQLADPRSPQPRQDLCGWLYQPRLSPHRPKATGAGAGGRG